MIFLKSHLVTFNKDIDLSTRTNLWLSLLTWISFADGDASPPETKLDASPFHPHPTVVFIVRVNKIHGAIYMETVTPLMLGVESHPLPKFPKATRLTTMPPTSGCDLIWR